MEIQTKVPATAVAPAVQQYNQDIQTKAGSSAASGVVLDIQSRQEPLGVALSSALQLLVENTGLSQAAVANSQSSATGPEGVATKLSSVAARIVSTEGAGDENVDSLTQLFESIKQSIDQGFDEAARVAADPANVPLQQAKDLTHQHLNALEGMLGLRDKQA